MEQYKPETQPDRDILASLQEHQAIKEEIERLQKDGIFDSTISNLKQEIDFLRQRKDEIQSSLYNYDADDKIGLEADYNRVLGELAQKEDRLNYLSQDMDMLDATIKDFNDIIADRAQKN